jgi:hypothetical protein
MDVRWCHNSIGWWLDYRNPADGKWYYTENGWFSLDITDDGVENPYWYFFDNRGYMVTGWAFVQKHSYGDYANDDECGWFYLNTEPGSKNGAMVTGWQQITVGGVQRWYYFQCSVDAIKTAADGENIKKSTSQITVKSNPNLYCRNNYAKYCESANISVNDYVMNLDGQYELVTRIVTCEPNGQRKVGIVPYQYCYLRSDYNDNYTRSLILKNGDNIADVLPQSVTFYYDRNKCILSLTADTGIQSVTNDPSDRGYVSAEGTKYTYFEGATANYSCTVAQYYVFKKWSNENTHTGGCMVMKGDVSLTATATRGAYTILYDANGGTDAPDPIKVDFGIMVALSDKKPEWAQHHFQSWNTRIDGSGRSYSPGAQVKNLADGENGTVTLYAQWSAMKITMMKASSNRYHATIIKRTQGDDDWYNTVGKLSLDELMALPEDKCVGVWSISKEGIIQQVK